MFQLLSFSKYSRKTKKALLPLQTVVIELTQRCNLKCKHCYLDANISAKNELSTVEVISLLRQAKSIKLDGVSFTGGEPFIREDINLILREAERLEFKIGIATNGTLIKNDDLVTLKKIKYKIVHVSLDGACSETHDEIRGVPGAFEKALKTIRLLKRNKIPVTISTTIMYENFSEVPEIINLAKKLRVKWSGGPMVPLGRGEITSLDPVVQKVMDEGIPTKNLDLKPSKMFRYVPCLAGLTGFFVSSEGKALLCPLVRDLVFGDIRVQSLSEIWEKVSIWQRNVDFSKTGECSSCEYLLICGGGCYAGGVFLKPEEIGKKPSPVSCAWARYSIYHSLPETVKCARFH